MPPATTGHGVRTDASQRPRRSRSPRPARNADAADCAATTRSCTALSSIAASVAGLADSESLPSRWPASVQVQGKASIVLNAEVSGSIRCRRSGSSAEDCCRPARGGKGRPSSIPTASCTQGSPDQEATPLAWALSVSPDRSAVAYILRKYSGDSSTVFRRPAGRRSGRHVPDRRGGSPCSVPRGPDTGRGCWTPPRTGRRRVLSDTARSHWLIRLLSALSGSNGHAARIRAISWWQAAVNASCFQSLCRRSPADEPGIGVPSPERCRCPERRVLRSATWSPLSNQPSTESAGRMWVMLPALPPWL
jgi:hypothetical protein